MRKVLTVGLLAIVMLIACAFGMAETLRIPDKMEEIGVEAFMENTSITDVLMPEHIKRIEERAFADCGSITINFPESLAYIADDAFENTEIINFEAPVGSCAYKWGIKNGYITLPESVNDYTYCVSNGKYYIKGYIGSDKDLCLPICTPDGDLVAGISGSAFIQRTDIESIVIPGYKEIPSYSFKDCKSLRSVYLEEGTQKIGRGVFSNDVELTYVHLANSINHMGDSVLYGCTKLTAIQYPLSMTINDPVGQEWAMLDKSSFLTGSSIEEVIVPYGATTIFPYAFAYTSSLKRIYLPRTVELIAEHAFEMCNADLVIQGNEGSYAEDYALEVGLTFEDVVGSTEEDPGLEGQIVPHPHIEDIVGCNYGHTDGFYYHYGITDTRCWIDGYYNKMPGDVKNLGMLSIPSEIQLTDGFGESRVLQVIGISHEAFSDISINTVIIPGTVIGIETDAFKDTDNLTVVCREYSYAETWAKENQINCRAYGIFGSVIHAKVVEEGDAQRPVSNARIQYYTRISTRYEETEYILEDEMVSDQNGEFYIIVSNVGGTVCKFVVNHNGFEQAIAIEDLEKMTSVNTNIIEMTPKYELIYTWDDFRQMIQNAKKDSRYMLMNDITVPGNYAGFDWYGVLNGNGHTIDLGNISISNVTHDGEYGWILYNGGTLLNINFKNVRFSLNKNYSGKGCIGLVGINYGMIDNCVIQSGSISMSSGGIVSVGGFAGTNAGRGTIRYCVNKAYIYAGSYKTDYRGSRPAAGGIAGTNYGTIVNCLNMGNVTAQRTNVISNDNGYGSAGGISASGNFDGAGSGTVSECANTGTITATGKVEQYDWNCYTNEISTETDSFTRGYSTNGKFDKIVQITMHDVSLRWPQAF